jgi:membrane protein DedA with SNARE-associated domain
LSDIFAMLPDFVARAPLPSAFFFLLLFGFLLPISEEIAVALVGVAMKATGTRFVLAAAVALAAVLIQDTCYFLIARFFGARIIKIKFLARFIKPRSVADGERYFRRRGPFVVFMSRFVVGLRAAVIMGAGFLKMRWSRFILYDLLAAAIMAPAWLSVGFALGTQFDGKIGGLTRTFALIGPVAVVIGAFLIFRSVKADKARADAEP